ncbi:MAG: hypothetical protein PHG16_05095 [Lachnospiraceae bacterium]|nr:hypothetical protein [Lachnospiraceae bacterium]
MAKKKDTGYRVALTGAQGTIRILLYLCGLVLIIYFGKSAYSFGYDVFNQVPVAATQAEGEDVTVVIKEGTSAYGIGKVLKDRGVLNESPLVFWVQERLSDYHGKLKAGSYILNTSQNVDEMFTILSGENTEGQPQFHTDTPSEGGEDSGEPNEKAITEGTKEGGE